MQLAVHMKLESDGIFGNGMSVPGGEDISVQTDVQGFPFLKGSTFKGIFREELINYLAWEKKTGEEAEAIVKRLMGVSGSHDLESPGKMIVSDLCLHPDLIKQIQEEEEAEGRASRSWGIRIRIKEGTLEFYENRNQEAPLSP